MLHESLVGSLQGAGLEVRPTAGAAPDGIYVTGTIDEIDAGSGAARVWWGFGAGQSRFVVTANLYNVAVSSSVPAVTLHVTGGSKGRGGVFAGYYMSVADAKDAAEQIAKYVKDNRR